MRRLLPLFVCACGLFPEDDLTGRRSIDGVGPWEDLGAVEMCLATRRIGPGGSTIGGLCAAENAPPEPPCVEDGDCGSRERCVCGRCTVKYCSGNGECGAGFVCNFTEHRCARKCSTDDDCPGDGEFCQSTNCRRRCQDTSECQIGEVCGSQGRCVVGDCVDDTTCLLGEICRVQREPRVTTQPSVLHDEGTLTMWFEMSNAAGTERAIWRATSSDGVHYRIDPARPVLEDAGAARAPSVLVGARYQMHYENVSGIAVAESDDGVAWTLVGTVLAGDFHAPSAILAPGEVHIFAHVGDRQRIVVARGGAAPVDVLLPSDVTDPARWRDVMKVGSPAALLEPGPLDEPTVRLWFDAFGAESGDSIQFGTVVPLPPSDSIGYASMPLTDTVPTVYPFNPIFDRTVAFLQHQAELAPLAVRAPDGAAYFLYYEGAAIDGSRLDGIGVARNPRE